MYIPKHFRLHDQSSIDAFVREHSFGVLITHSAAGIETSHLPMYLDEGGDFVYGHMALANPQWKAFSHGQSRIVFHGPHTYISPNDYASADGLPTWNYTSIAMDGEIEILDSTEAKAEVLDTLIDSYESGRARPWALDLSDPTMANMLPRIVCFRMRIEQVHPKLKLSQNKTQENRIHIASQLRKRGGQMNHEIAKLMQDTTLKFSVIEKDGRSRLPLKLQDETTLAVLEQTQKMYASTGFEEPWTCYLALEDGKPVGTCGFKSPPQNERIEIAYYSFPGFEGRGLATSMAKFLVNAAKNHQDDVLIAAQTLALRNASHRILEKLGFTQVSIMEDPDNGQLWEWQIV